MDSRKILKKLLAALEVEQAIPDVNQEEKAPEQAPINDEIQTFPETDCVPFPEAVKYLYRNPWPGGGRCNELLLLGPLTSWPCVCLKAEKHIPNQIDWTITCAKNMDWKRFFNDQFKIGVKNRLCAYVKTMVKNGCLMPAQDWKEYFPIIVSVPFYSGQPDIFTPQGNNIPILEALFDTQNGDNPCIVCLINMMRILELLLKKMQSLLNSEVEAWLDVHRLLAELWLLIADCLQQAMEEGGATA